MDNAVFVQVVDGAENPPHVVARAVKRKRPGAAVENFRERIAPNVLHHQQELVPLAEPVQQRNDVRVLQAVMNLRLAPQAAFEIGGQIFDRNHFYRNIPVAFLLPGAPHLAHAAGADQLQQNIIVDFTMRSGRHRFNSKFKVQDSKRNGLSTNSRPDPSRSTFHPPPALPASYFRLHTSDFVPRFHASPEPLLRLYSRRLDPMCDARGRRNFPETQQPEQYTG